MRQRLAFAALAWAVAAAPRPELMRRALIVNDAHAALAGPPSTDTPERTAVAALACVGVRALPAAERLGWRPVLVDTADDAACLLAYGRWALLEVRGRTRAACRRVLTAENCHANPEGVWRQ